MNIVDEIWQDVPAFEGFYQASNHGRVRSCDRVLNTNLRNLNGSYLKKGQVLTASLLKTGYLRLTLCTDCKRVDATVHQIIAWTFLGDRPKGFQINHIDGNKQNNSAANLEYCTVSENQKHSYRIGLHKGTKGEKAGMAKLKNTDIVEIRSRIALGHTQESIAKDYGVNHKTISNIKTGKTWKHI